VAAHRVTWLPNMRLTDEQLRDVLARAEEIDASRHGMSARAELDVVINAAEDLGLSRAAVELAMRERLLLPPTPPVAGSLAFAKSIDGKFHVAEVLSTDMNGARVRFLGGSDHSVALDEIRPCTLVPGERVMIDWPWWGPWLCTIVRYDSAHRQVKVSDGWGSTETVSIAEVWQVPATAPARSRSARAFMLLAAGSGIGALIGSLITAFFMR
jgi:hypothetical protein